MSQTQKELQRFLGFSSFYRWFIRDFSKVVALLTNLTSPKISFQWSSSAQQAFKRLKQLFSLAPILAQADLNKPFMVEVDASDSGVGAVLSQHIEGKLQSWAFFFSSLSLAGRAKL